MERRIECFAVYYQYDGVVDSIFVDRYFVTMQDAVRALFKEYYGKAMNFEFIACFPIWVTGQFEADKRTGEIMVIGEPGGSWSIETHEACL